MIESKKSTVGLIEGDILYFNLPENTTCGYAEYEALRNEGIRLVENSPVYNLIHIGDKTIPDQEAREAFCNDKDYGLIRAQAIVIHSLAQRIIAQHVVKEKRERYPIQIFTSAEDAMVWINELKSKG